MPNCKNCHERYTTYHELQFIERLGTFNPERKVPRRKLLANYIKTAIEREDWAGIDKEKCIEKANELLSKA